MQRTITDLETWLLDNDERIYRFLVYRRIYTPYEQEHSFSDESFYEDDTYNFGYIQEAIDLGNGDWLLGFRMIAADMVPAELLDTIEYYRLSEIRLSYFEYDQNIFEEEYEEEE